MEKMNPKDGVANCLPLVDKPFDFLCALEELLYQIGKIDCLGHLCVSMTDFLIIKDEIVNYFLRTGKDREAICTILWRSELGQIRTISPFLLPLIVHEPRQRDLAVLEGFLALLKGWGLTTIVASCIAGIMEQNYKAWLTYLRSCTFSGNRWVRGLVPLCIVFLVQEVPTAASKLKEVLLNLVDDDAVEIRQTADRCLKRMELHQNG